MKVALLGNGNNRNVFLDSTNKYDYTIGCNIPWTKVDATVVMDANVLDKMETLVPFYCSRIAWRNCNKQNRYSDYLIEIFDSKIDYDSAGHCAARIVLMRGATEIDIYGCDSWFKEDTESYTHKYIDSRSSDMSKHVLVWRERWHELMNENANVKFNFIGD